jgi:hypothetical protein
MNFGILFGNRGQLVQRLLEIRKLVELARFVKMRTAGPTGAHQPHHEPNRFHPVPAYV